MAQAAIDYPGPELEAVRAVLYLARARELTQRDLEEAETFFARAAAADGKSRGKLSPELRESKSLFRILRGN